MPEDVFIYDAIRTPRGKGKPDGALHEVLPVKLAEGLLRSLQKRNSLDTKLVDCVIMGCVNAGMEQAGHLPKAAVYMADWDLNTPAIHVNSFCASGLTATNMGAQRIAAGSDNMVVTGGIDCMSRCPFGADGVGPIAIDPEVVLKHKAVPVGVCADLIAVIEGFSRDDCDEFGYQSQMRASHAMKEGYFDRSIVPVRDETGVMILDHDELIRPETTREGLAKLKPSFEMIGSLGFDELAMSRYNEVESIPHIHHPGSSSGVVDGAALIILGNRKAGEKAGLQPRARFVASTLISTDPCIQLTGPAPATMHVLEKAGLRMEDIDLFECNEAFASIVLRFMKHTGAPHEKVNVNGGAIAMGHPLGATGAMLLGTVLDELERREQRYGLITMCVGGGMGVATIIERVA